MKKTQVAFCGVALLLFLLVGCGRTMQEQEVDLNAFFNEHSSTFDLGNLVDLDSETRDAYYPGLGEIKFRQFIAKMPMMSSVVNEVIFAQCETEEDAKKAAEIFQKRIDQQAEGGAFYPESIEGWKNAKVLQKGTYVAMIASAQNQSQMEEAFGNLFA